MSTNINQINIKKKLKKNKKWIAAIITTATIATGGITIHQIREKNNQINTNQDYIVGYDDINLLTNNITQKVGDNNFILLDIKDHDSYHHLLQKLKLNYCQKKSIDIGLVISSDSHTLGDVYLDLEYLLGIMEQYEINYPIYLNVDYFIENEDLTYEEALTYINAFLTKAELNNLYIGVLGKEEYLKENFSNYDKLITENTTTKDGMIFQENNYYYANKDLKETIQNSYLNYPNCFQEDDYYIWQNNDNIIDIAKTYGLSVADLKKFNDIDFTNIKEGTYIRIPTQVQSRNKTITSSTEPINNGIDVSVWQGEIDWEQIDTDFAIIQVRDFINEKNDIQFTNNVLGCIKNDIPMGFYVFSRASTLEGIQEEAKYTIEQLRNIEVTYPIYLDLETEFWDFNETNNGLTIGNYNETETKQFVLNVIKTWESEIYQAGYIPGIYCSQTVYNNLVLTTDDYINQLATWIAGGSYYEKEIDFNKKDNLPQIDYNQSCGMRQISSYGKVNGIYNTNSEYADIDYCYVDYENLIYKWDRMTFQKETPPISTIASVLLPLGSGIWIGKHLQKRKYKNRRKKRKRYQ